jgi:hypothetical protein
MTEREIESLVDVLATNPTTGNEMPGTGGCRKVRVAGRGKGKSGEVLARVERDGSVASAFVPSPGRS